MTVLLIVPLLATALGAVALGMIASRLRPDLSARLCSIAIVAVMTAGWLTALFAGFGYLAHLPFAGDRLRWCREALGVYDPPSAPVGCWVSSLRPGWPLGFAEPGPKGGIVVSSAMFAAIASLPQAATVLSAGGADVSARVRALSQLARYAPAWGATARLIDAAILVGAVLQIHHLAVAIELVGRH